MARRISWKLTLACCQREVFRATRPPGGRVRCHFCNLSRPPDRAELIGGVAGTCPRGHHVLSRNALGRVYCLDCHKGWRERQSA